MLNDLIEAKVKKIIKKKIMVKRGGDSVLISRKLLRRKLKNI